MTLKHFSQRALNLLYQGVLHRDRLLEVYCILKAYEAGNASDEIMQVTLDRYDPELEPTLPFNDEEPPF